MKKIVNVLVIEDNRYCNNLISKALLQSVLFTDRKGKYQLSLHSFIDPIECIRKIKSGELTDKDIIAFVDYYMGNGITGTSIIDLLKKQCNDSMIVLLSPSKVVAEEHVYNNDGYFVIKDIFAPALCRLYLEQFIDNKF